MISFEDFWQLLYDHGSRNYYKNETFTRWNELLPEQQQSLYDRISEKIRAGKFVDYNPLEAIHDNLQRTGRSLPEPINYFGKPLSRITTNDVEILVRHILTAYYNSRRKLPSRAKTATFIRVLS